MNETNGNVRTARIEIADDLQSGRAFAAQMCDGDTVTVYGIRYQSGVDCGDGASLTPCAIDKYPDHYTIEEIGVLHDLPVLQMTAEEYDKLAGGCLADEVGHEAIVSIFPDNTYCVGQYDGNQYCDSLI